MPGHAGFPAVREKTRNVRHIAHHPQREGHRGLELSRREATHKETPALAQPHDLYFFRPGRGRMGRWESGLKNPLQWYPQEVTGPWGVMGKWKEFGSKSRYKRSAPKAGSR